MRISIFLSQPPEYLTELREYGTVYSSWAECEEELQRPLEGVAGCVATCCRALEDQSESMSQDFLPVLKEYVLYIEAMKVSGSECEERKTISKPAASPLATPSRITFRNLTHTHTCTLSSSDPECRKCLHVS